MTAGRLRVILAPVILGVLVVAAWQLAVIVLAIPPFVLPGPVNIATEFVNDLGIVGEGMRITGTNALIGFLIGSILALVGAVISASLRAFDQLTQPLVTIAGVIPLVALAPVLYAMFDSGAETTRQLIAALAVFVPVYLNALRGLRQVKPVHRDLMRAYAATPWQMTRTVTLPGALPYVFTGLRIASSLAVISALISEYFGGPVDGLATSITSSASQSNFTVAYAFVVGAVVLGLAFYLVTLALEKFATRHSSLRTQSPVLGR